MNRHLADKQIWQFVPVWETINADEFISVSPFRPANIHIGLSDGIMVIRGHYGIDLFPNHKFTLLVDGEIKEYCNVEDIPERFDNVIKYEPDSTHDITFTYTFKRNGKEFNVIHWIHHDMKVWEVFLPELIKRETNRGWK